MKPPAWMKVSAPYMVGNKVFVDVEVKRRHPAFLRMMWGAFRQEIRRQGHNPNDPWMLLFTGWYLVKIFVKGK